MQTLPTQQIPMVSGEAPISRENGENGALDPKPVSDTTPAWQRALDGFLHALQGGNYSEHTIRAYATDLRQFLQWLEENTYAPEPSRVERADITEFLSYLSQRKLSGVTRARKLAAIRELFRHLEDNGELTKSPCKSVETPKKERNRRRDLRPEEYHALLAQAGGNLRDYAILQVLLQTGVRVSELCGLRLDDLDMESKKLWVRGKGNQERDIPLESKAREAIKNWLAVRPQVSYPVVFVSKEGNPLTRRVVHKLVAKYKRKAGIEKKISPHTFRHTFSTQKLRAGAQLPTVQRWLGHKRLDTTQIYIHMASIDEYKVMELTSL